MLEALECAEDLRRLADAVSHGNAHEVVRSFGRHGLITDQSPSQALLALAEKSSQLRLEALAQAKGDDCQSGSPQPGEEKAQARHLELIVGCWEWLSNPCPLRTADFKLVDA
jgi:hypothetical protein